MTEAHLQKIADRASELLGRPGSISPESVARVFSGDSTPSHPADQAIKAAANELQIT